MEVYRGHRVSDDCIVLYCIVGYRKCRTCFGDLLLVEKAGQRICIEFGKSSVSRTSVFKRPGNTRRVMRFCSLFFFDLDGVMHYDRSYGQ